MDRPISSHGERSPARRRAISSDSFDYHESSKQRPSMIKGLSSTFSRDNSTHSIYASGSPSDSPRSTKFLFFGSRENSYMDDESHSRKTLRQRLSIGLGNLEQNDENHDNLELLRLQLKEFIDQSTMGQIYSLSLLVMSIFSCFQFLIHTYSDSYPRSDANNVGMGINGDAVEFAISCIFTVDWGLSLFIAEHRGIFLTSFFSMVDLLTVIPTFIMSTQKCPYIQDVHDGLIVVYFILCGLKMTRILRILRLRKRFTMIEDEIQRFLANMALNIVVMIVFNSAVMHYLEPHQGHSFHTWVYYMIVTCTTVGYGDISPKTDWGRFAAMTMISFAIITVPSMTNELISKMGQLSIYARARYIPKTRKSRHVLICGDSSSSSLYEFFEELFHEDHDVTNLYAVILQPGYPNSEVMKLLRDTKYQQCITYLDGTAMNEQDLRRAAANKAKAIFVLANKFTTNPDEEDAKTILQNYSIRRFFNMYNSSGPNLANNSNISKKDDKRSALSLFSIAKSSISTVFGDTDNATNNTHGTVICMQLLLPDNRRHVSTNSNNSRSAIGSGDIANEHLVVCLNETKMGVIAKACIFQGTNTLIMNLLSSFADNDNENSGLNDKDNDDISILDEDQDSGDWFGEYQRGCTWEIYTSEISQAFEGISFCALSEVLYAKLGVVLFGLEVEEISKDIGGKSSSKQTKKMVLNPGSYVIPSTKDGSKRLTGLIIAQNKAQSDISFKDDDENSLLQRGVDFRQLSLLASSQGGVASSNGRRRSVLNFGHRPKPSRSLVAPVDNGDFSSRIESKEDSGRRIGDQPECGVAKVSAWQSLLRSYEKVKTSEQLLEELQRREEMLLKKNFYLRSSCIEENCSSGPRKSGDIVDVHDVIVATTVVEELPFIKDHIIIAGKSLNNLYDCIRPLRAKNLGPLKHIVILFPKEFPQLLWQKISVFESIWIVRGSSMEDADLIRCGIFRAKQVLLLADSSAAANVASASSSIGAIQGNDFAADADIIFTYHAVKRLNPALHIVVEMVRPSNMHYLTATSSEERNSSAAMNNNYKFTPQFASGSLFLTSFLDTLVCQSFYNTRIVDIVHKMIVGEVEDYFDGDKSTRTNQDKHVETNKSHRATFLQMKSADEATFGNPPRTNYQRDTVLTPSKSANEDASPNTARTLKGSSLYQIPLPDGLSNRTYGALYKFLTARNMIPLGLLRGVLSTTKMGPKGNKSPYVFTNPNADTEVFTCDRVFVLSQQTPSLVRPSNSSPPLNSDASASLSTGLRNIMKGKKTSADDVLTALSAMKRDVDQFQQVQGQFEFRLQQMHGEFSQSIATAISMISQHQEQSNIPSRDSRNVRFRSSTLCSSCSASIGCSPPQSMPVSARSTVSFSPHLKARSIYKSPTASRASSPVSKSTRILVNSRSGIAMSPTMKNIAKDDNGTVAATSVVSALSDIGYSLTTPFKVTVLSSSEPHLCDQGQHSEVVPSTPHTTGDSDVLSMNSSLSSSPSASPDPSSLPVSCFSDKATFQTPEIRSSYAPVEFDQDHEHSSAMVAAPVSQVVRPKSANRSEFQY